MFTMNQTREIIAIPMGDAAGIGPEITAKALANKEIYDLCRPVVIGDKKVFQQAIDIVEANLTIHPRSEEHTSELQSRFDLVCRLLLEKKNNTKNKTYNGTQEKTIRE